MVWIEIIITDFIGDKEGNQDAGSNAKGKATDFDQGIHFLFAHLPKCNCEVVPEHRPVFTRVINE